MQPLGDDVILRFQHGEEAAFNAIFRHFNRPLFKFSQAIVQSDEEARDITAEAFASLWSMKTQWDTYVNVRAFLYLTVRSRCYDYLRRQKTLTDIEKRIVFFEKNEQRLVLFSQVESEIIARISEAVERLPDYYKRILKLSYHEGYKNQEIAEQLGINEKTVRNAKSIAVNQLKKFMKNRNIITILLMLYL